ncbi:MAG: hypothetical protein FWB96_03610 [Defluviitaleaceae bacterium]|nr:hypothetical protein [Defluviitaleaceae bacterium]MCL2262161.1 hypothetical protein [Defluviitaleaceae bacterium]
MNKLSQIFVIATAVAVLIGALWFWLYFRPHTATMERLRAEIVAREAQIANDYREAQNRRSRYAHMTEFYAELSQRWEVAAAALPYIFDDTEVLRHIQDVIYPHTSAINMSFNTSTQREGDLLYATVVSLQFETSYWQFLSILYNLVQGDLGNRVVVYTLDVSPLETAEFISMRDTIAGGPAAGYIPPHIRPAFMPGAQINPIGLHTLSVRMQVEYLSIQPGLLSEADLRAQWARLDALADAS